MNTPRNLDRVRDAFSSVQRRLWENPNLVLTESDLKCQLYFELVGLGSFSSGLPGQANLRADQCVHSETKFVNEDGHFSKAPDLIIINPTKLRTNIDWPGTRGNSKAFSYADSFIAIELKFFKSGRRADLRAVERDILKIHDYKRSTGANFHLFVAVFDRFETASTDMRRLQDRHRRQTNLEVLYLPRTAVDDARVA